MCCDFAGLKRLKTHGRIYGLFENALGRVLGHFFDVHSTFGAVYNCVHAFLAVQQDGDVKFFCFAGTGVIHVFRDVHLVYFLALWRRLGSNKLHAQDGLCFLANLVQILGQFHASAFSATPCMDLGFHNKPTGSGLFRQFFGSVNRFVGGLGYQSALGAHTEATQ